ncbi:hypothetical protein ccbrp13_19960 [Ktedonobacteria bacterium brp13]|nr:hypothetical protein ccbrp13_19960 [Ktedonobacteria bacterium brp13]
MKRVGRERESACYEYRITSREIVLLSGKEKRSYKICQSPNKESEKDLGTNEKDGPLCASEQRLEAFGMPIPMPIPWCGSGAG